MFMYRFLLMLPFLICLLSCGEEQSIAFTDDTEIELKVMSFNIEWGGTNINFDNVVEAIRLSGADVVGIQEAEGNLERLAADLGWYFDLRNYLVSRFPIIDPPGANGTYVYIELMPGKVVAIANTHLPSDPDGVAAVRDGSSPEEVIELERAARLSKLTPFLEALEPVQNSGIPLFLTGDFNSPSHRDWTTATVNARPFLRYALDWPVSVAMEMAGFTDAWREAYSDPLANPGLTWWAARPPLELYSPGENDPQERIDFIWFDGSMKLQSVIIVGETDGPEVSISVDPWPSDHRALVAEFLVTPVQMSAMLTTDRRIYLQNDDVHVRYDGLAGTISVNSVEETTPVAEQRSNKDGRTVFSADIFQPGHYVVQIAAKDAVSGTKKEFWVVASDANPSVRINRSSYKPGEAIGIEWNDAPGNRNDYVAVYPAERDAQYGGELAWAYVKARPAGSLVLDEETAESFWPLEPGAYRIRLMKDDGYLQLAESSVFVVE
jgi:endonuclease/exonuclease/phosphatase family metal-dependent hydrolase